MPLPKSLTSRRQWLQHVSWLAAGAVAPVWAQPAQPAAASRGLMVAQLVDFSSEQQDVSKDFLIGSRSMARHQCPRRHSRPAGRARCGRNRRHACQCAQRTGQPEKRPFLRGAVGLCRRPARQPGRRHVASRWPGHRPCGTLAAKLQS